MGRTVLMGDSNRVVRRRVVRRALWGSAAAAILFAFAGAAAQPAPPAVVEVKAGDTFSAIAARYTGSAASWRTMYRPDASNLPNPNVISIGMRLEVASDAAGRYL